MLRSFFKIAYGRFYFWVGFRYFLREREREVEGGKGRGGDISRFGRDSMDLILGFGVVGSFWVGMR